MSKNISENDYRIFEQSNKKYIYVADSGMLFEADDKTIEILKEISFHNMKLEDAVSLFHDEHSLGIIKELIEVKAFKDVSRQKKENGKKKVDSSKISSISLLVAQSCNLRCTYCYGEDGQYQDCGMMDSETALKAVDFFVKESASQDISICFFGGEPLLNFKVIRDVVDYCHEVEKAKNKKIHFSMTTNGTLITPEIEKFIIDNQFAVQISLDGDEKTQNENRFDANHKGSYSKVIENTETLRKKGLLGARATLTPFNLDVKDIYKHLDDLGFRKIIISPAFNLMKENDYEIMAEKYIEWYDDLESELKAGNYKYVKKSKLFIQELRKIDHAKIRATSCGVGQNLVAIDIHGNVFPCQRFVSMKEFCIGNINNGMSNQKHFLKKVVDINNDSCEKCWARNLCVSGCPFCNISDSGEMHQQNPLCCEYEKKVMTELINIYLRLSEEEKAELLSAKN